ncbi:hypothetical protein F0562_020161 [Nyssa sinensis]|uniref:Uncharacterized protein n=1 Tax=Nyssa sinensis TaxID=561372 RepID=A0A5J5BUD6_9ASTE|nr:hypothetical protein F0562_020161 [Nyssa sinensis]
MYDGNSGRVVDSFPAETESSLISESQCAECMAKNIFLTTVEEERRAGVRDRSQRIHRLVAGPDPPGPRLHHHPRLCITWFRCLPPLTLPDVRLVVHQADVLDAKAVPSAVEGCTGGGVFHVASP